MHHVDQIADVIAQCQRAAVPAFHARRPATSGEGRFFGEGVACGFGFGFGFGDGVGLRVCAGDGLLLGALLVGAAGLGVGVRVGTGEADEGAGTGVGLGVGLLVVGCASGVGTARETAATETAATVVMAGSSGAFG